MKASDAAFQTPSWVPEPPMSHLLAGTRDQTTKEA
jgi:hypothetical protein